MSKTEIWTHLIPTLDVVIDALGGAETRTLSEAAHAATHAAAENRPAGSPRLGYIYTSGTWVHGDSRGAGLAVSDTTPLATPTALVAWRVAAEQRIQEDPVLNGVVIRPALLYGRGGSILAGLFQSAADGKARWPGAKGTRMALVHADDLADLYVRAAERAPVLRGLAFDAANDVTESAEDVLAALVRISGAAGSEMFEPTNGAYAEFRAESDRTDAKTAFEEAMATTATLRPYLARSLLGWQPRKAGLVDGLETYYAAWQAAQ
jgi:nucleoside-diphosphate-sugar epimerase